MHKECTQRAGHTHLILSEEDHQIVRKSKVLLLHLKLHPPGEACQCVVKHGSGSDDKHTGLSVSGR